ncbi:MAG: haloacid dehalogenase-like hydrolase [Lachnospiraceae bacterium]|nr:haloacid dehalogenase-like hydrolase [Lachnospiraceae bacterium]
MNRVMALCYDFDKTLSPTDMQAQGYIQSVGYDVNEFWKETDLMSEANNMDGNLAYMYLMMKKAEGNFELTKEALEDYGSRVLLNPGVSTWFDRINEYGKSRNTDIEHYIISSGLREMIEGTEIARRGVFKEIYASSFYYDENGKAVWPAQAVNYTNKTQFLFRISKGFLNVNDKQINDKIPADKMRIPFRNMVYIGDSETDIPCMKLVNSYGGHSIGVYDNEKGLERVRQMMRDERIRYYAKADYSEGGELETILKLIIDKTVAYEALEDKHVENLHETFGDK